MFKTRFLNKKLQLLKAGITFSPIFLLFLITACEETVSEYDFEEYPVVEAYLVAGEPVDRIHVFKVSDFLDSITSNNGIGGLDIFLNIDTSMYLLSENSDTTGYYYYEGNDLDLHEGDYCSLSFEYNGKTIFSETTIPEKPANLGLSKNTIYVYSGFGGAMDDPIEITWDNPDDDFFYMVAENIEDDPTPINDFFEDEPSSFGTAPSTTNLLNIEPRQIRFYGTYRLVIFRVQPEFTELSQYTTTNTINLTEPYTNIINGKGIFTAWASDTLFFEASSK